MSKALRNYLIDSVVVAVAFIVLFGLILGLGKPAKADTPIPDVPTTYVTDETGVLSPADKGRVEQRLARFERSRPDKPQLVVLIIKNLPDQGIEQFATDTFRKWGVGQKGLDNGVLWIVHPKPENHADMRLEIGRRIEGDIPDLSASDINVRTAGPFIRKGQYADAIVAVADKIEASLPKPVSSGDEYYKRVSKPQGGYGFGELLFLAVVALGTMTITLMWLNRRQRDIMARDKRRRESFSPDPYVVSEAKRVQEERDRRRAETERHIRKAAQESAPRPAPPSPLRPTSTATQTTLAAGAGVAAGLAAEAAARRARERREEEERAARRRRSESSSSSGYSGGYSSGGSDYSSSPSSPSSSSPSDSGYSGGGGDSGGGGSSDSI